ncbi:tRNA (guanine(26)-N(2))-dimethyltransferase [Bertholletia excelsa]
MGDIEKTGEEEKQGTNAKPFDLNDYTIIKEGEAEILMHVKNEVFYNKTQVNNRDMSIAVLRAFISKRKEEHETMRSRRTKALQKELNETAAAQEAPIESDMHNEKSEARTESDMHNEKSNHECQESVEISQDEPCSISEDPSKTSEGKGREELKPPRVLEALSASGLRALRYAREVEGIGQVVALDNDKVSVEACRRNIKFNGSVACEKVESHLADARVYMLTHPKEFDVVDLDPYGSPSVFLDSAIQSVVDGGMLMCTATDMAVLCGGNGEVCYSKYGSYPLRGKYCHEMALRILLACIEGHANRYKRYVVPVLSVQMDFYVRVFVRIYTSASAMKNTPLKLSYVYQCIGCDSFHLQPIGRTVAKNNSVRYLPGFGPVVPQDCSDCGKKYNMGGPIWSASIHDQEWVTSILANVKSMKDRYPAYDRISAVLTTISEELPDVPLFLSLHNLCATLKCTSPSAIIFRSAVINAGYRISEPT